MAASILLSTLAFSMTASQATGQHRGRAHVHASTCEARVDVYSTQGCPYCVRAKGLLKELSVPYEEIDVGAGRAVRAEMERRTLGRTSLPQIFIGDVHVGGCDDLVAAEADGRLYALLQQWGVPWRPRQEAEGDETAAPIVTVDAEFLPKDGILNHWPVSSADQNAVEISQRLQRQILGLYDSVLSADGSAVDYRRMAADPAFRDYAMATSSLRHLACSGLPATAADKICFWGNLYNALVMHGMGTVGPARGPEAREAFFGGSSGVRYRVAGFDLSLDDLEHGILRGSPPFDRRAFPEDDPRQELALRRSDFDARIHFVLNCGARSCPPIKILDAEQLDEALDLAFGAFCESTTSVDCLTRSVTLSKIFLWYARDFGDTERSVLEFIAHRAPASPVVTQLRTLLERDEDIVVDYAPYDWGPNDVA